MVRAWWVMVSMCMEGRVGLTVVKVIDCGVEGGMAGSPNTPWMSEWGEGVKKRDEERE